VLLEHDYVRSSSAAGSTISSSWLSDPDATLPYLGSSASVDSPPHRASTPLSDAESRSEYDFSFLDTPSSSSAVRLTSGRRTVLQSEIDQFSAMFPRVPLELVRSTLLEYGSYRSLDQFLLSNSVQECVLY
jgi:hypothetical protein